MKKMTKEEFNAMMKDKFPVNGSMDKEKFLEALKARGATSGKARTATLASEAGNTTAKPSSEKVEKLMKTLREKIEARRSQNGNKVAVDSE